MQIGIPQWIIAVLYISFAVVPAIKAGCYQKKLCCSGRNLTCIAVDDGIKHLPILIHPRRRHKAQGHHGHPAVYDNKMNRIGELVLPDLIALDDGTITGLKSVNKKQGDRLPRDYLNDQGEESLQLLELPSSTTTSAYHELHFGEPFFPREQPPEITRYYRHHKLIRYSLLNRHIPLIIKDSRGVILQQPPNSDPSKLAFLENTAHDKLCYCDEKCITFGDCCSDYTFVCPPTDCALTEWSEWSECVPDQESCGVGVRTRKRTVERKAERGGKECPPLVEKMSCFKECQQQKQQPHRQQQLHREITTVALILDYSHSKAREKFANKSIYSELTNKKKLIYYCVTYKLGWVNQNCIDKKITAKLYTGNSICAECQPEAQKHRYTATCGSDLLDEESGFWKLIGPKSCNGIWKRISRTDHCRCEVNFPKRDAFLLV